MDANATSSLSPRTVATSKDLPRCHGPTQGVVYYVAATSSLVACSRGQWINVDIAAGEAGRNALVATARVDAGARCANGGLEVKVGVDTDRDGVLDDGEVTQTTYVCDGQDGRDGRDGRDGTAGGTTCAADADCDDANPCTLDFCAAARCEHDLAPATTLCRPAAGACDVAEHCTGTSSACPADALVSAGIVCAEGAPGCAPGACDGTSSACAAPETAGTECAVGSKCACGSSYGVSQCSCGRQLSCLAVRGQTHGLYAPAGAPCGDDGRTNGGCIGESILHASVQLPSGSYLVELFTETDHGEVTLLFDGVPRARLDLAERRWVNGAIYIGSGQCVPHTIDVVPEESLRGVDFVLGGVSLRAD